MKFIHSAALLHRDIKPSNILVDSSCLIKLCDFGLCRSISSGELPENIELTDYVATRWYRSPEILMGSRKYNEGIDLWSVGCIIGEMFRCRPLIPGASTMAQVEMIFELTGNPTAGDVNSWQSPFAPAILQNVQAILEASGSSLEKVIKASVFVKDMNLFGRINVVYGEYFKPAFAPARELVQVSELPKFVNIEISVIAHI